MQCVNMPRSRTLQSMMASLLMLDLVCYANQAANNTSVTPCTNTMTDAPQAFAGSCACEAKWMCRCCKQLLSHQMCSKLLVNKTLEVNLSISYNNRSIFDRTFAGYNIPPFCMPLLPTVPLALSGCVQLHNLTISSSSVHTCANATFNVAVFQIFNFKLGCASYRLSDNDLQFHTRHNSTT